MEKLKNIPKIRFPEFEGVWKRKTLGKLAIKIGDGLHGTPTYCVNSGCYFINGNNLFEGKIQISENTKEVSIDEYESNYKGFTKNTLLVSINGTIGNVARFDNELVMLGKSVGYFTFIDDCTFIYHLLKTDKIQQHFIAELTGTTIKNLSLKTLRETEISYPSLPEQTRIASFFTSLDLKITQLKQKKTLLEQYKKGVMQKLFSQELRFKDKEGKEFPEWNKKTLGEISSNIMYGLNAAAVAFDGKNKYIRITDIDESSRSYLPKPLTSPDCEIEEKYKLKEGDILFTRTGASVGKTYLYNKNDGNLAFAGFLIKFSILNENPFFIFSQTLLESYNKWILKMSMRSGQPGINAEEYKCFRVQLPCIQEQSKIANLLSTLDKKINHTQLQIEQMEQWKKGLLQNMFC